MSDDEALRRRLRFSRWLQVAAAVLFLGAFGVRVVRSGWDGITVVLLLAGLIAAAAAIVVTRTLRAWPP